MKKTIIVAAVAALALGGFAIAQTAPVSPSPIKRIPLQKFDVPGTDYETVIGIAEIAPNVDIGRHSHPGMESGYVIEGDMVVLIDGQPPKPMKAGESYQIPLNGIHTAKS